MAYLQLIINPGSTSTKLALYRDEKKVLQESIDHKAEDLHQFERVADQVPYRLALIRDFMDRNGIRGDDNNKGGRVAGSITVNIEETGCQPVIIGELYGGGNLAGYSIYGYKQVNGDWEPRTSANDEGTGPNTPYASPVINVKSFTGIGNVFGGGYGQGAVMIADPTVNINVVKGRFSDKTSAERFTVKGYVLEADPNNSGKKRYSKTIGGNTVYVPEHKILTD